MAVELTNVSNPAAFGVEWANDGGGRCQLTASRGSTVLMLGFRPAGASQWTTTRVESPARFGFDPSHPPRTWAEFLRIAQRFVGITHVDYPHEPGRLYDCPACEEGPCACDPETDAPCVSAQCVQAEVE